MRSPSDVPGRFTRLRLRSPQPGDGPIPALIVVLIFLSACASKRAGERAAAAPVAPAAAPDAPERWLSLESRHFALMTDQNAADAQRLVRDLEEYFAAMVAVGFRAPPADRDAIPIVALAKREETLHYLQPWADGVFFSRLPYRPFIVLGSGKQGFGGVIVRHELVHTVTELAMPRDLPTWYAEGLATYFETLAYDRERGQLLLGRAELSKVELLKTRGPYRPVADLMNDRARSLVAEDADRAYATWWLLMHFLIHDASDVLVTYQRALAEGRDATTAWQSAASTEFRNALDERLARYVTDKRYLACRRMVWSAPAVGIATAPVSAATALATGAMLDVVGTRQQPQNEASHRAAARDRVVRALALDPTNLVALQVSLALGDRLTVLQVREALRGHEGNWMAWMLLFEALMQDGQMGEGRAAFVRAATLAPAEPAVREIQQALDAAQTSPERVRGPHQFSNGPRGRGRS
ncbi:MAG: DUF1570 domain-containing protein [Pseudomonadota bacterium]